MHSPPRVLFVCGQFRPVVDGTGRQAERLAAPLFRRGVPVEVLTSRLRGTAPEETIASVPMHRVSAFGFDRSAERCLTLYRELVSGTGSPSCAS